MKKFLALLRKDWRLNRAAMITLLITALGPYVLLPGDPSQAAVYVSILNFVPAAALGGAAFARERREHWDDFLAVMPVSQLQIISSKLLVALGPLALTTTLNIAVLMSGHSNTTSIEGLSSYLCLLLAIFGLAWLLSALLPSPAIAAVTSLLVVVAAAMIDSAIVDAAHHVNPNITAPMWAGAGVLAVFAGCICHARRLSLELPL